MIICARICVNVLRVTPINLLKKLVYLRKMNKFSIKIVNMQNSQIFISNLRKIVVNLKNIVENLLIYFANEQLFA